VPPTPLGLLHTAPEVGGSPSAEIKGPIKRGISPKKKVFEGKRRSIPLKGENLIPQLKGSPKSWGNPSNQRGRALEESGREICKAL